MRVKSHEVAEAPIANTTVMDGEWRKTTKIDLTIKERRLWIEIPTGFTEMQQRAPERALAWRMDVRQMFEEYLAKGYRAVDFVLQREAGFWQVPASESRAAESRAPVSPGARSSPAHRAHAGGCETPSGRPARCS